jgi:hypothetical protein
MADDDSIDVWLFAFAQMQKMSPVKPPQVEPAYEQ